MFSRAPGVMLVGALLLLLEQQVAHQVFATPETERLQSTKAQDVSTGSRERRAAHGWFSTDEGVGPSSLSARGQKEQSMAHRALRAAPGPPHKQFEQVVTPQELAARPSLVQDADVTTVLGSQIFELLVLNFTVVVPTGHTLNFSHLSLLDQGQQPVVAWSLLQVAQEPCTLLGLLLPSIQQEAGSSLVLHGSQILLLEASCSSAASLRLRELDVSNVQVFEGKRLVALHIPHRSSSGPPSSQTMQDISISCLPLLTYEQLPLCSDSTPTAQPPGPDTNLHASPDPDADLSSISLSSRALDGANGGSVDGRIVDGTGDSSEGRDQGQNEDGKVMTWPAAIPSASSPPTTTSNAPPLLPDSALDLHPGCNGTRTFTIQIRTVEQLLHACEEVQEQGLLRQQAAGAGLRRSGSAGTTNGTDAAVGPPSSSSTNSSSGSAPCICYDTVVLQLYANISIARAGHWPTSGFQIWGNVVFEAPGAPAVLDLDRRVGLWKVRDNGFVSLRNVMLVNMPVSPPYIIALPIHAFTFGTGLGLDDTVAASSKPHLTLSNCTMVVTPDEFDYVSFWLQVLSNPSSSQASFAAWMRAIIRQVDILQSTADMMRWGLLAGPRLIAWDTVYTRTPSKVFPQTRNSTGLDLLLSEPYKPMPLVLPVSSSLQLQSLAKLSEEEAGQLTARFNLSSAADLVLLLTQNLTLSRSEWPPEGVAVSRAITIQGMPGDTIVLDFNGGVDFFLLRGLGSVTLKDLVLARPGHRANYTTPQGVLDALDSFAWAFKYDRQTERIKSLRTTVVLSSEELLLATLCIESYSHNHTLQGQALAPEGAGGVVPALPPLDVACHTGLGEILADAKMSSLSDGRLHLDLVMTHAFTCHDVAMATPAWLGIDYSRPDLGVLLANTPGAQAPQVSSPPPSQIPSGAEGDGVPNPPPGLGTGYGRATGNLPADESDNSSNLGAVLGAVLGSVLGALLLSLAVVLLVLWRRHRRSAGEAGGKQHGAGGADARAIHAIHERLKAAAREESLTNNKNQQQSASGSGKNSNSATAATELLDELHRLSYDMSREVEDNQVLIHDVLGSGAFGTVYRGTWHGLPVAVKAILFSHDSSVKRQALQEAALSKSISHPNIVSTYTYDLKPISDRAGQQGGLMGQSSGLRVSHFPRGPNGYPAGGCPSGPGADPHDPSACCPAAWRLYIIQEFCDAGSLRTALDRRAFVEGLQMGGGGGAPRMEMVLDVACQVASGLAHLHGKNIIHGDLNPCNVLLKKAPTATSTAAPQQPPLCAPAAASLNPLADTLARQRSDSLCRPAPSTPSPLQPSPQGPSSSPCQGQGRGQGSGHLAAPQQAATAGASGYCAKIADFGLSVRVVGDASHVSNLRQGTPMYTAPEVAKHGLMTKAADAYAFGICLWELYHSRRCWVRDKARGLITYHPLFPHFGPSCPQAYADVATACLSHDHAQRPTIDMVAQVLAELSARLQQQQQAGPDGLEGPAGTAEEGGGAAAVGAADSSDISLLMMQVFEELGDAPAPSGSSAARVARHSNCSNLSNKSGRAALPPIPEATADGGGALAVLLVPTQLQLSPAGPHPQPALLPPVSSDPLPGPAAAAAGGTHALGSCASVGAIAAAAAANTGDAHMHSPSQPSYAAVACLLDSITPSSTLSHHFPPCLGSQGPTGEPQQQQQQQQQQAPAGAPGHAPLFPEATAAATAMSSASDAHATAAAAATLSSRWSPPAAPCGMDLCFLAQPSPESLGQGPGAAGLIGHGHQLSHGVTNGHGHGPSYNHSYGHHHHHHHHHGHHTHYGRRVEETLPQRYRGRQLVWSHSPSSSAATSRSRRSQTHPTPGGSAHSTASSVGAGAGTAAASSPPVLGAAAVPALPPLVGAGVLAWRGDGSGAGGEPPGSAGAHGSELCRQQAQLAKHADASDVDGEGAADPGSASARPVPISGSIVPTQDSAGPGPDGAPPDVANAILAANTTHRAGAADPRDAGSTALPKAAVSTPQQTRGSETNLYPHTGPPSPSTQAAAAGLLSSSTTHSSPLPSPLGRGVSAIGGCSIAPSLTMTSGGGCASRNSAASHSYSRSTSQHSRGCSSMVSRDSVFSRSTVQPLSGGPSVTTMGSGLHAAPSAMSLMSVEEGPGSGEGGGPGPLSPKASGGGAADPGALRPVAAGLLPTPFMLLGERAGGGDAQGTGPSAVRTALAQPAGLGLLPWEGGATSAPAAATATSGAWQSPPGTGLAAPYTLSRLSHVTKRDSCMWEDCEPGMGKASDEVPAELGDKAAGPPSSEGPASNRSDSSAEELEAAIVAMCESGRISKQSAGAGRSSEQSGRLEGRQQRETRDPATSAPAAEQEILVIGCGHDDDDDEEEDHEATPAALQGEEEEAAARLVFPSPFRGVVVSQGLGQGQAGQQGQGQGQGQGSGPVSGMSGVSLGSSVAATGSGPPSADASLHEGEGGELRAV